MGVHHERSSSETSANPLPRVDLIFCREVTIHLPSRDVLAAIRNFKASGSTYLLITHHLAVQHNGDILPGGWRAINFTLPPFCFPEPLQLIHETDADQHDKAMALWRIDDLPLDAPKAVDSATSSRSIPL